MRSQLQRGLYAITDSGLCPDRKLAEMVAQAIRGGARVIQFRDKRPDPRLKRELARSLLAPCHQNGVPLLINDDLQLALDIGADGVHLGQDDANLGTARSRLGQDAIIGVSCYNRIELAQQSANAGADYVAFGRFFPSSSKPGAVQADPALLGEARQRLQLPVVAIGGITPENGGQLIQAGADLLAVIHGVFGQPDILEASAAFNTLFKVTETQYP